MNKKTILFFSRSELVHLYGKLHDYLYNHFDIIHVAYSNTEAEILSNKFGISNVLNFKEEFNNLISSKNYDDKLIHEIDRLFIFETNDDVRNRSTVY